MQHSTPTGGVLGATAPPAPRPAPRPPSRPRWPAGQGAAGSTASFRSAFLRPSVKSNVLSRVRSVWPSSWGVRFHRAERSLCLGGVCLLLSRAVCCRYCLPVSPCVTYSPLPLPGPRVLAQATGTSRTPQAARTAAVCSSRSWRAGRLRSGRWQPWWAVRTVFLARGPAWAMSPRGLCSVCVLGERGRAPAPSPPPMRSLVPPGAPPWWPQDPR